MCIYDFDAVTSFPLVLVVLMNYDIHLYKEEEK